VTLDLEALLEGVLEHLDATGQVLLDLTSKEKLLVVSVSKFTELHVLFIP
jgi:hypothetical protein